MSDEVKVPSTIDNIQNKADDICLAIQETDDQKQFEDLCRDFTMNNIRKNVMRANAVNKMLDAANNEAYRRITERPEEISTKEILDYMAAAQNQLERCNKIIMGDNEKDAAVQINNPTTNTVNITVGNEKLDIPNREERNRITSLIADLLGQETKDTADIIDSSEIKENKEN